MQSQRRAASPLGQSYVKFSLTQTDGIWASKMAKLFFDSSLILPRIKGRQVACHATQLRLISKIFIHTGKCCMECPAVAVYCRDVFPPPAQYVFQRLIQIGICLLLYPVRNSVCGLGNAPSDSRQRIAVTAKGYGIAYGILEEFLMA